MRRTQVQMILGQLPQQFPALGLYPALSGSITEAGRQLMGHDDLD